MPTRSSSLEVAAVLQQVIADNLNKNRPVYVALLDVKKAFDSVWQQGMFVKLHNMGMDPKLWRILVNNYSGFKCAVRVGNMLSEWFEPESKVSTRETKVSTREIFSMKLHSLYTDGLLSDLRDSTGGSRCGWCAVDTLPLQMTLQ